MALSVLVFGGCFVDSTEIPDDDEGTPAASTSTGVTSASGGSTAAEGSTAAPTAGGSGSGDATGADTTGEVDSGDSTGPGVGPCSCPDPNVLCEAFDGELTRDVWSFNSVPAGGNPELVEEPVACGTGSLRSGVESGDSFALAQARLESGDLGMQVRMGAQVRLSSGCLEASPPPWTRTLALQIGASGATGIWYEVGVWFGAGIGELRMTNHMGGTMVGPIVSEAIDNDEWIDLEVVMDFRGTPTAELLLNGTSVGTADGGPALPPENMGGSVVNLGPYQITDFEVACQIHYDDLWVASP